MAICVCQWFKKQTPNRLANDKILSSRVQMRITFSMQNDETNRSLETCCKVGSVAILGHTSDINWAVEGL